MPVSLLMILLQGHQLFSPDYHRYYHFNRKAEKHYIIVTIWIARLVMITIVTIWLMEVSSQLDTPPTSSSCHLLLPPPSPQQNSLKLPSLPSSSSPFIIFVNYRVFLLVPRSHFCVLRIKQKRFPLIVEKDKQRHKEMFCCNQKKTLSISFTYHHWTYRIAPVMSATPISTRLWWQSVSAIWQYLAHIFALILSHLHWNTRQICLYTLISTLV